MEESIKNGIAEALSKEFGKKYHIYTENIEQGLKKPCFFILLNGTRYEYMPMNRFIIELDFTIKYMIGNKKNCGIHSIAEKAFGALRRIECEYGLINAFNTEIKVFDESVDISVTYCMSAKFIDDKNDLMEN